MRKIFVLSVLLATSACATIAENNWLNYEKEAKITDRGVCDNGNTKKISYRYGNYQLSVTIMVSGETFFNLLYRDLFGNWNEKFFMKSGDKIIEIPYKTWDLGLKSASPNSYAAMHGGEHDCRSAN